MFNVFHFNSAETIFVKSNRFNRSATLNTLPSTVYCIKLGRPSQGTRHSALHSPNNGNARNYGNDYKRMEVKFDGLADERHTPHTTDHTHIAQAQGTYRFSRAGDGVGKVKKKSDGRHKN